MRCYVCNKADMVCITDVQTEVNSFSFSACPVCLTILESMDDTDAWTKRYKYVERSYDELKQLYHDGKLG